jgi:hypothetical protein
MGATLKVKRPQFGRFTFTPGMLRVEYHPLMEVDNLPFLAVNVF